MLVYVSTDQPQASKQASEFEQDVLGDEDVALGARLFKAIRIKGDKLGKDHPYWQTLGGKELPRLIVVDTAGQKISSLEANDLSGSNVFKAMKRAAAKTYKTDLEKVVKDSRDLLDEMDRIDAKQKQLDEKKKTAKGGKEQEIAAEQAKLAQQMKDVQARETELLKKVNEDRKVTKN